MSADSLEDNLLLANHEKYKSPLSKELKESSNNLKDSIKDFISSYSNLNYIGTHNLTQFIKENKHSHSIIISSSALKCTRILKNLKDLGKKIGKLFSKHLKIKDQFIFLKKVKPSIIVGTPNRLLKLYESLYMEKLEFIFLDLGLDLKQLSILDIKDTRNDLIKFLDKCQEYEIKVVGVE